MKTNFNEENLKYYNALKDDKAFQSVGEHNSVIKQVKNIIANTKPNPEKLFIAEGIWAHQKIVETSTPIQSFIVCLDYIYTNEAIELIKKIRTITDNLFFVSSKTFDKISERERPDGLLSIAYLPRYKIEDFKVKEKSIILVLDGIEIPGNIGTMLRVCDGAAVDAVFICNRKARLTHPKLIKGSMYSVLTVPILEFENVEDCYNWLNKNNFKIYLADTRAEKTYFSMHYKNRTAFVMGSERYGISRDWYNYDCELLSIPMLGKCDSLNVGVAATVLIYDATMKIKLGEKYD